MRAPWAGAADYGQGRAEQGAVLGEVVRDVLVREVLVRDVLVRVVRVGRQAGENRWSLMSRAPPMTPAVGPNSPRTMGRLPVARGSDWR